MNYAALTRRFAHPGVWGNEQGLTTQQDSGICENTKTHQQLWATLSATLHGMHRRDDQWVTLIGKPAKALIEQLIAAGIRPDRIRRVSAPDQETVVWATEQALLINNSQLVIAWIGDCQGRDKKRLELAARASQARSFLFSSTSYENPVH
ncbi:hypothetical protein [Aliidiomarina sanyensis]|uniref:SOS-response cell division inhibitor n=1 Tax=Aliidiomarina sanyensis TaxID=1249555 RepID=A0A432WPB7_9GAMM|nr:hypothetical protein [Aliidiomarina sanyensis]RUO35650.1 hypothetical protein CWE11_02495 [Aliidiomarina sanyensis]